MANGLSISVFEVVGSHLCVASDDGQKVYECLAVAFQRGRPVTLSFRHVSTLTPAFLSAAVGQLYGQLNESDIRTLLKVEDMKPDDMALLERVVDRAKQYFQDPERFEHAVEEVLREASGEA
jgi:hypothetical protein